jgi:UDP-N-acetylmuramyl pentapeptide phosphotransferase/UDP-N-acetylglucosamine-1-phosphate transferase
MINIKWVIDPKNDKPSVSLTLLLLAVTLFVIAGILNICNIIDGVGVFSEFLYTTCALYFGRKLDMNELFKKK